MIRTRNRLGLCIALLVLNLTFIWGNSLLPGEVSGALSKWVKDIIALLIPGQMGEGEGHGLLRKLAHFTEFCTLGMCLRWLFGMLAHKKWMHFVLPLGAGFLAACIDETIQLFVPGRGPGIKDVGIDTVGVLAGVVFITIIYQKTKYSEDNKI